MPSTKLAKRIVINESPITMTDAFLKAMNERTSAILEGFKSELAPGILFENEFGNIEAAVGHIMNCIGESGINALSESIEKSAKLFKVERSDLIAIFENIVSDNYENNPVMEDIDCNKFQRSFLSKLDNILEQKYGNILGFLDTTSAYVTPLEGKALVEVYLNLNNENRQKMVEKLVSNKQEFKKILNFAVSLHEGKLND